MGASEHQLASADNLFGSEDKISGKNVLHSRPVSFS